MADDHVERDAMPDVGVENTKLITTLSRFASFVQEMDGKSGLISFRDSAGFLGREEDYKSLVAENARKALDYKSWRDSQSGRARIADCARKAMQSSINLVNMHQVIDFSNRLDPSHPKYSPKAVRVLYDLYCNPACNESEVFEDAVEAFGANYATIAFLFFIKDDSRFLPISPRHFDKAFDLLGIDYKTTRRCDWENYRGYLDIMASIQSMMQDDLPLAGSPRLIDAHSFVWIIQQDRFINWIPNAEQSIQIEHAVEDIIQREITAPVRKRESTQSVYTRSAEVARETRKRAKGICQLCGQPAPFEDREGEPFLEVHHIAWLSRGGNDSTDNTVALCPNCHRRMHVLDLPEDVEKLKEIWK